MDYALILVGLVALIFGGDILVRGASGIAKKMKLSPLVVGMTVVAFGTSSPELMVSVNAALMDSPEIALGNVIGSNIANVTMILGITVLIYPLLIDKNSKFIDWPVMLIASILFYLFALNGRISSLEGTIFFAGLVVFTIFLIRQSFKNNKKTCIWTEKPPPCKNCGHEIRWGLQNLSFKRKIRSFLVAPQFKKPKGMHAEMSDSKNAVNVVFSTGHWCKLWFIVLNPP